MTFGKLTTRINAVARTSQAQGAAPSRKRIPRSEERKPTYKVAKIRATNLELRCVVLDISPSGAKVKLEGAIGLPEVVVLVIPDMAFKKRHLVRWQDGDMAGLMVEPPPPATR